MLQNCFITQTFYTARGSDCVQIVPGPAGGHLPVCGDHPDPHPLQRHHLAGLPHLLLLCQARDHPHQILPPGLHELQVDKPLEIKMCL